MVLRSAETPEAKEMTMNVQVMSSLKAFTCGAAALALTAVFSWSFVESTSVSRWATAQSSLHVTDVAVDAARQVAKSSVAALVD
jgi:hypothetical protein